MRIERNRILNEMLLLLLFDDDVTDNDDDEEAIFKLVKLPLIKERKREPFK